MGAVVDFMGLGDHVDVLIQEISRFVLGYSVLAHGEQDLDSHCSLLHVFRSH